MKITSLIIGLSMLCLAAFAQTDECGTVLTNVQLEFMDATRADREAMDVDGMDQVTIPLVAHIIRRSDGTGGLSLANLTTAMAQLNGAYEPLEVQFELCIVNYIDSDTYHNTNLLYSTSPGSAEYNLAIPNRVDDKVNIFFVPNLSYCGWSSFPSYKAAYDKDWTIMNNDCAINGSTLAHELGHYFNLYHTHQGPSSGIVAAELVDRSNCGPNVGDELCDTPADPNLSGCVNSSCQYTCAGTDSNGDLYVPDPTNVMSYSQKACRTLFSPQQRARILQSYLHDRNNLAVSCSSCPSDLVLSGTESSLNNFTASNSITATQDLYPSATVTYQAGNQILLKPGFRAQNGCDFQATIQACPAARMAKTVPKNTQITSIADTKTTATETERKTQETGSLALNSYPNPFQNSTTLAYTLAQESPVMLTISDLTGRLVKRLVNKQQAKGQHLVRFDARDLPVGMYLARLQVNGTISTIKLMVMHP